MQSTQSYLWMNAINTHFVNLLRYLIHFVVGILLDIVEITL